MASVLASVAQIAAKYSVDSGLLLKAFAEAWAHDKSRCGNLEIECRRGSPGFFIILIMCRDKVVWQFPVERAILEKPEAYKSRIPFVAGLEPKPTKYCDGRICNLKAGMSGISVTGRVREVPPKTLVGTRYGLEAYVSNILLADESGSIRLSLWEKQIDGIAVGDTVKLENASTKTFRGHPQLRLGKSGKMSVDTSTRDIPW